MDGLLDTSEERLATFEHTDLFMVIIFPICAAVLGFLNVLFLFFTRINNVVVPEFKDAEHPDKKHDVYYNLLLNAERIKGGAMAFLKREYSYLFFFVIIMGCIVGGATQDWYTVGAFVLGAFLSAACGWIGMRIAVVANYKTTYAAESPDGLNAALKVAFASGSVMGFGVVCSGILGLVIMYSIASGESEGLSQEETRYMAGFGFGASSIALFARVGGGIYTKAADVGADLVGKVEAGMDEDSPLNPATIADNVGDNVGDVAGMGADLFESFVGGIIACMQLAPGYYMEEKGIDINYDKPFTPLSNAKCPFVPGVPFDPQNSDTWCKDMQYDVRCLIELPFYIASAGIACSCIGIYAVRTSKSAAEVGGKNELQETLLWTIRFGIFGTSFFASVAALIICGEMFDWNDMGWKLWGCTAIGLVAGIIIGVWTEYATSFTYKPTQTIAKKGKLGPAPVVIQGIGIGMLSTMGPTIVIFITILVCYELGRTYGIGLAAVGMLSTLGITLATDAFGPVADNAGGLAEMAEFPEEVRETTDGLDALGNTTAATGKGFAIGSAVLSALALLSAFTQDADIPGVDVSKSEVLAAAIWGACLPFIFAAMTMMAVGRAATMMIQEVRAQIKQFNLLSDNPDTPDYDRCIEISTNASVLEMIIPGLLAVASPLFIGYLLGPEALGGMLVGGIICGFMLAVYMANSGGAWDNAKKYVEAGLLIDENGQRIQKGTPIHAAVVSGDTIGDPFKDTSGPSLNILMKLMTMISLVFAKDQFKGSDTYDEWWIALIIGIVFMIIAIGLTKWMRAQGFGKLQMGPSKEKKDEVRL